MKRLMELGRLIVLAYPILLDNPRVGRAMQLVMQKKVKRVGLYVFYAQSQYSDKQYRVDLEKGTCTCPDYEDHKDEHPRWPCKHRIGCLLFLLR